MYKLWFSTDQIKVNWLNQLLLCEQSRPEPKLFFQLLTMLLLSSSSVMSRESLCLLNLQPVPSSVVPSQCFRWDTCRVWDSTAPSSVHFRLVQNRRKTIQFQGLLCTHQGLVSGVELLQYLVHYGVGEIGDHWQLHFSAGEFDQKREKIHHLLIRFRLTTLTSHCCPALNLSLFVALFPRNEDFSLQRIHKGQKPPPKNCLPLKVCATNTSLFGFLKLECSKRQNDVQQLRAELHLFWAISKQFSLPSPCRKGSCADLFEQPTAVSQIHFFHLLMQLIHK